MKSIRQKGVRDAVVSREEILAVQLIENLQREDLNPIDEANAYFAFLIGSQTGMERDGMGSSTPS